MKCLKSDENSAVFCSEYLKNNEVVIIPTDTVYGFSGIVDLENEKSGIDSTDKKIRKIKGREESKPFIQLISKKEDIFSITDALIPQKLLDFWPGPLTIIVPVKNQKGKTVAVRCPGDEWLRKVISLCGKPIYSTSVNRSGNPVLTEIEKIVGEFENEVGLIVCDGDSKSSVPSTIVSILNGKIEIVRKGAVKIDL